MQTISCHAWSPIIYCEVVEKMRTSTEFYSGNKVPSFSLMGNYYINSDVMNACYKISENNITDENSSVNIVNMLNVIGYVGEINNWGNFFIKGMIKSGVSYVMISLRSFLVTLAILILLLLSCVTCFICCWIIDISIFLTWWLLK